jgi:hypothetical protein
MSPPRKGSQNPEKTPIEEVPMAKDEEEEDVDTSRVVYDDTKCLIVKETTYKWGEIYQMFNNQTCPQIPKKDHDLKVFMEIKKYNIYKVETHVVVFPYVESILWIIKHIDLEIIHIINTKGRPIGSFKPSRITSCYHLEEGEIILDDGLVKSFPHSIRDMLTPFCRRNKEIVS